MLRRKLLEAPYRLGEIHFLREIEGRVEQSAFGRHRAFGDCNSVQRSTRINPQPNCEVNCISPQQPPTGELQRLLQRVTCFTRTANEENPEGLDSMALYTLSNFSNFGGAESLFQLLEHCVAGAFAGDASGFESGAFHRAEELRGCGCRREVGRVELNPQAAARDGLAHL